MASGKQHRAAYQKNIERNGALGIGCMVAAVVLFAVLSVKFGPIGTLIAIVPSFILFSFGAGWWCGLHVGAVATPDHDMGSVTRSDIYTAHWPHLLRRWWARRWQRYADIYPHRHRNTHEPGHSTRIRLYYLVPASLIRLTQYPLFFFWCGLFLGMYRQDVSHARLDKYQYEPKVVQDIVFLWRPK